MNQIQMHIYYYFAKFLYKIKSFIYSAIPTNVLEIIHIDPSSEHVETIYNAAASCYLQNHSQYTTEIYPKHKGYFAITVWNSNTQSKESHFLSYENLCKALQIRNMYPFWAITDFGIADMLENFTNNNKESTFFAILYKTKDISADPAIIPLMRSITRKDNVSVKAIQMYYEWTQNNKEDGEYSIPPSEPIILVDYDFEEKPVSGDDLIM